MSRRQRHYVPPCGSPLVIPILSTLAQGSGGHIHGVIQGSCGAPEPDTEVVPTNADTCWQRRLTTSDESAFAFSSWRVISATSSLGGLTWLNMIGWRQLVQKEWINRWITRKLSA